MPSSRWRPGGEQIGVWLSVDAQQPAAQHRGEIVVTQPHPLLARGALAVQATILLVKGDGDRGVVATTRIALDALGG